MSFTNFIIYLVGLTLPFASASAQSKAKQAEKGKLAKELVSKAKAKERKARDLLIQKLDKKRRQTMKRLAVIIKRYERRKDVTTVAALKKTLTKIENSLGKLPDIDTSPKPDGSASPHENPLVRLDARYQFRHPDIRGTLKFQADQTLQANFHLNGKNQQQTWQYETKSDHLVIHAGEEIGDILLSEIPGKNKRSVMLRWGSKFHHAITIANIK